MRLASSNTRFCWGGRFLPARFTKNWIMRMPEPIPLGLTFLLAMTRAMVRASFVKVPGGGNVETVFTSRTHRFFAAMIYPPLISNCIPDAKAPLGLNRGYNAPKHDRWSFTEAQKMKPCS